MDKVNILNSWILVEQLSEGKFDRQNTSKFDKYNEDYYEYLKSKIDNLKSEKTGLVIYFNVFNFDDVIQILKKDLDLTDEEIPKSQKFSLALYFDKDLKINSDLTFFTISYYIKKFENIPGYDEFKNFENKEKENIKNIFNITDLYYKENFNSNFNAFLYNYNIDLDKTFILKVDNLESSTTNLHSFFIKDLEKAKEINDENINNYLSNNLTSKKNLDTNSESENFNPDIIEKILEPKNYPLGRFPTNNNYSLSLMQQVAVNLAIDPNVEPILTVNGPPGTGKTTLLKDIFADLIVKQSLEIYKLKGNINTKVLPKQISEKGILVASSNNGAVQNIVNELPLKENIYADFLNDLVEADYFLEIANSNNITNKEKWRLFSLEGGKKSNMHELLNYVYSVFKYLENDYIPKNIKYSEFEEKIFKEFENNYNLVIQEKENLQNKFYLYKDLRKLKIDLNIKNKEYPKEKEKLDNILNNKLIEYLKFENKDNFTNFNINNLDANQNIILKEINENIEKLNNEINLYKNQKVFIFFFKKRKIRRRKIKELNLKLNEYTNFLNDISNTKTYIDNKLDELQTIIDNLKIKIKQIEEKIYPTICLDMNLNYNDLQISNPWFDKEYRKLQTNLFISSLKLRKLFLYKNRENIRSSINIWKDIKKNIDNPEVIVQSWEWINMVIPVISTTFASIDIMFKNIYEKIVGRLFIDEAGQALPQASVGAILRSRRIMAVGDPAQIKPVLTLDSSILEKISVKYGINPKTINNFDHNNTKPKDLDYLSENASTQTLLDNSSNYGFYKKDGSWIGIPLWVHRRCKDPMFDISNDISYDNNMVQGTKNANSGKIDWYDIKGKSNDKYIEEQGDELLNKIKKLIQKDISLKENIFVITPFRNVAKKLENKLKEIDFSKQNIGTVHTFQCREASIVFFVLGCDDNNKGAANWAIGSSNPNIMNVAATRAKDEFYIIGDLKLFSSINSPIISSTKKIISKYKNNIKSNIFS